MNLFRLIMCDNIKILYNLQEVELINLTCDKPFNSYVQEYIG